MIDRRYIKIEVGHAQDRTKRKRLGFTLSGWEFLNGTLSGCFVSPSTGFLQLEPNSENASYQTSDAGPYRKLKLSDVDTFDGNTPAGEFVEFAPDHPGQAIKFVGENTAGVSVVTKVAQPENRGYTASFYVFSKGTDQKSLIGSMFWDDGSEIAAGGVWLDFTVDGQLVVYYGGYQNVAFRGPFSGTGYTPGTVQGGTYARPVDEWVTFRVEVDGRVMVITSSKGGVIRFAPYWATDRYAEDGSLETAALPVLPAKKWGWSVPEGGASVIAAPVLYPSSGYAISEAFQLEETPTYVGPPTEDALTGRVLPYSPAVTVTLKKEDGVTGYDRTERTFKARVDFSGSAFVSGVVGAYPRIAAPMAVPEDGPFDVTEHALALGPIGPEDGPMGVVADLVLRGDCPVPNIDEQEGAAFLVSFVPSPDDPESPPGTLLLDAVGDTPEWVDGYEPKAQSIHIRLYDRMALVREAQFSETTVFDGLPLCQPPQDGESVVGICLREGGLRNAELADLPTVLNEEGDILVIDDTPGQRAGEWNFAAKARQIVSDILEEAWEMAPQYAWGLKPTVDGTRAYGIDVQGDEEPVATFYRTLEAAESDPGYQENELGAWPLLYGKGHKRIKLPKEGNVVRVNGYDPATGKGLQAYVKDDASADPTVPNGPDKLGFPRLIFVRKRALTTQAQVNGLALRLKEAIAKRQYIEPWPAFMRFKEDGSPVWRGDMVLLKEAKRDGSDSKVRVASLSADILDESGAGLADEDGNLAPVSVRLCDYVGGAIVGAGGRSAADIAGRQIARVMDGGSSYGETNVDGTMAYVVRLP